MNTFSFRADTIHYVFELMLASGMKVVHRLTILLDPIFPDVEEELLAETTQADAVGGQRRRRSRHRRYASQM